MLALRRVNDALMWTLFAVVAPGSLAHVIVSAAMQSQQATATPDVTKLGPQVGEKVPDFTLPDQHGQTRTLASLMGPTGLVLVFNRSADW
jgi:hypothetical protein